MLALENAEEVLQILDRYTKQKSKDIPPELDEYLNYVAKTGDTVYRWPTVQYLFREKLINVIKEFHDTTASIEDLPQCPNVDQFNYESMKSALIEKLERFQAAPFTIQRLCELLTDPKKHYSRLDKFMRALEKNILVVSTVEPGRKTTTDGEENGDEPMNGVILTENNIDVINKENNEMDDDANGSAESIDNIASKLTEEEPATDIPSSAAITSSAVDTIHPAADTSNGKNDASNGNETVDAAIGTANADENVDIENIGKIDEDAVVSEEPIAAAPATETAAAIDETTKDDDVNVDMKDESKLLEEEPLKVEEKESTVAAADAADAALDDKAIVDEAAVAAAVVERIINSELAAPSVALKLDEKMDDATDALIESEKLAEEGKPEIENKTDEDKVLVDESKPEEIAQIIDALDLPPVVVEKPLTPKHSRDENHDDDDADGVRDAKKMRLVLNDEIDAAIASLPASDVPSAQLKVNEKSEIKSATQLPTSIGNVDADSAKEKTAVESVVEATDTVAVEPIVAASIEPSSSNQATDTVEQVTIAKPASVETIVADSAKIETVVESEAKVTVPVESVAVVHPIEASTEATSTVDKAVDEATIVDTIVPEYLAENLTALIPTDLLPAVNERDMVAAVVATEPQVNQESMAIEEPEAPVPAVEEKAEKMDAAPINDDQMDVDDAADAPMDL